jgi:hypothetical protein
MKTLLSTVLAALLCIAALFAGSQDAPAVAGEWQLSLDSPHGPLQGALKLRQSGAKFTGTVDLGPMGVMPVSGSVETKNVSIAIELPDGKSVFRLTGTLAEGKMSGSTEAGGVWSATMAGKP